MTPDPATGFIHHPEPNSDPVIIRTHNIHADDRPKPASAPMPVPSGKELAQLMADMIDAEAEHLRQLTILRAQSEVSWLATEKWSKARDTYRRMERLYSGTKAREKQGESK